jgi:hypothetical protein
MIEQVMYDPAMPLYWGKNQRGMVAEKECDNDVYIHSVGGEYEGYYSREGAWKVAAKLMATVASSFDHSEYSKEIVNRLLEPWMKTKAVVTATREAYKAFFKLRCHPDAQAEIRVLAERMREAIDGSVATELNYGDYHLPYVDNVNEMLTEEAVKISCSCAAQVSYRRLDDSLKQALKVYDMLNLPVDGIYPEDPPHYSPTEHIAKVMEDYKHESYMSGNFHSGVFWQYRKALEMGQEKEFIDA